MRDLVLTIFVFGTIPLILKRPFIGLLVWAWLSMMNPHRLAYGFAYSMPFAQIVAITLMVSMLVHARKLYRFPVNAATMIHCMFVVWVGVSPMFALRPDLEFVPWFALIKVQIMVLATYFLVGNKDELNKLVWVMAFSVAFYGIKGGVFTIMTGGGYRVWGPEGSAIADNNEVALAIIMTIPFLRYLQLQVEKVWIRHAYLGAMLCCAAAALGSQSRGALVAIAAMALFLWFKSRQKALVGILIVLAVPLVLALMPESWFDRMNTIKDYSQDGSALGRINAWQMSWNLAVDRFPIGGGFIIYTREIFSRYSPIPEMVHAAHSIYFQTLGNHGFMGLSLFVLIYFLAWRAGSSVMSNTRGRPDLLWARDLAGMCQVSLVGYAVGGAFLSLAYFDFPYYVVAVLVVLREVVTKSVVTPRQAGAASGTPRSATGMSGVAGK